MDRVETKGRRPAAVRTAVGLSILAALFTKMGVTAPAGLPVDAAQCLAQWLPPRCQLVPESEQKAGGALGDPTAFRLHSHHLLLLFTH